MEIWEWKEVPKTDRYLGEKKEENVSKRCKMIKIVIALSLKRAKYDFFLFVYIM